MESKISDLPGNKKRNVSDLARFIATRTENNPNYTLLLGAGCSISSGVRSGATLANEWRNEIYISEGGLISANAEEQRKYLKQKCSSWYDPAKEYSCLFERKFDLQRQRRMFVESEVSGGTPSIGYAYLTALIDSNYFGAIFTTNFDDLVNESFYLYSDRRPIVCAHDSSISSVTVTSNRPKVIKLHGDYLFDDIKSTARETESLEQNMKEKFVEFSKEFGLVVVGYSGGDRSIMDLLSLMLKNDDYFKGGIYWCLRHDSEIPDELKKLLWKDRVYHVYVDGFDELFSELYAILNNGDTLPLSALSVSRRPNEAVSKLLSNGLMFPQTNKYLVDAKEKLVRQSRRMAIAESIADPENINKSPFEKNGLTEEEMLSVSEVQRLISNDAYQLAIEKAKSVINSGARKRVHRKLLNLIIQAYRLAGNHEFALNACDELIKIQSNAASSYLIKAATSNDSKFRLAELIRAIEIDKYSVNAHLRLADHYSQIARGSYAEKQKEANNKAIEYLKQAIELDPSERNLAWVDLFDSYRREHGTKSDSKDVLGIIENLQKQGPYRYRVLSLRSKLINEKSDNRAIDSLLDDIETARQRVGDEIGALIELRLTTLKKCHRYADLKNEICSIKNHLDDAIDSDLAVTVADIHRECFGDDALAVEILKDCLIRFDFSAAVLSRLVDALCDLGRSDEAKSNIDRYGNQVVPSFYANLIASYFVSIKDFESAIREYKRHENLSGANNANRISYVFLLKNDYGAAEKIAREFLESYNFTPEAASETVNFEIARKGLGRKVDSARLERVLNSTASEATKAAVYAVLGKKVDSIASCKRAIALDMTFRFEALAWPAFNEIRNDELFIKEVLNCGPRHLV